MSARRLDPDEIARRRAAIDQTVAAASDAAVGAAQEQFEAAFNAFVGALVERGVDPIDAIGSVVSLMVCGVLLAASQGDLSSDG